MKTFMRFILAITASTAPGFAQWAVIDVANIEQSAMSYAVQVEQLSKQATEITNQVRQIEQFEMQLKRMGDMANVKNLVGFSEFRADLNLPTKIKTWAEGTVQVDGTGLFGDTRGGIFAGITSDFKDFDGAPIERDARVYKEAQDMTAAVDEFKVVQSDVYHRRQKLKQAIASTSEALQAADTEAEQKKLEAILNAEYGELATVDAEVALSAAEVQVKAAESTAMNNAQGEAEAEARRRLAQQEAKKISAVFKPQYECSLQFVSERRLSPPR